MATHAPTRAETLEKRQAEARIAAYPRTSDLDEYARNEGGNLLALKAFLNAACSPGDAGGETSPPAGSELGSEEGGETDSEGCTAQQAILYGQLPDAQWAKDVRANSESIAVDDIPGKGRGLVAGADLPLGTYVTVYGGRICDSTQARCAAVTTHMLSVYGSARTEAIDGSRATEYPMHMRGAMANDCRTPNSRIVWMPPKEGMRSPLYWIPVLQTKCPVRAGEELTIAYSANGHIPATIAYAAEEPDADADSACLPSGLGGRRKRKASGGQRRAKRAAIAAEEEEGGYTDKGIVKYREDGGVLRTGNARTCVPDGLFNLLAGQGHVPNTNEACDEVRSALVHDPDTDVLFTDADTFVRDRFGLSLKRVTKHFMIKGGPAYHLLLASGLFLVQLRITDGPDDKKPDLHCVAYDGATIRDNYRWSKVKMLDDGDRASIDAARDVFNSLVRGCHVEIKNIYQLEA